MSSEPQRVSAAFTSGVNPKIADRCCLPLVAQHDRSEPCFSRSASGGASEDLATDDNVNPCGPVVDIAEALRAGWFELWYQPKIGSHAQDLRGAEALIRMRHPRLGIIQPADFMLDISDRRSLELSQFVIAQALADWRYFFTEQRPLEISINLPISFLGDPSSLDYLGHQLPKHPAFGGLILEIDGSEITRDLPLARDFAKQARFRKIAVSVDRLGGEWAALAQLRDFPFVEIKIERELVSGFARDRSKQALCRHVVGIASQLGARTVAVGVETEADFLTARELGFDLVQGFLFARPMGAQTFVHHTAHDLQKTV